MKPAGLVSAGFGFCWFWFLLSREHTLVCVFFAGRRLVRDAVAGDLRTSESGAESYLCVSPVFGGAAVKAKRLIASDVDEDTSNPTLHTDTHAQLWENVFPPLALKLTKGDRNECNYTQLSRKEPLFEVSRQPLIVCVSPDSLNEGLRVGLSASRLIGRSTAA